MEIERKFLVNSDLLPPLTGGLRIIQGFLSEEPVVRVRVTDTEFGTRAWLTVKGPGLLTRAEYEYDIPVSDAEEMLLLCKHKVEKTRFLLGRWEIDKFAGQLEGLLIAEIELASVCEPFDRPAWLGEEVTYDKRYANVDLAKALRVPEMGQAED